MINFNQWPERIQKKFISLQYQSELLVATLQLGVICILFMVLILSPIGYTPDAPVHSAILGLSLFCIVTLVRLWFAYTCQLTPSFLGFSVIAEMSILLFTLWTYYLQFETSPVINLKNPHLNYVFVLIALRALRFEPIWVLLSGVTALVGWSFIVLQALVWAGWDSITWDYVTYASSLRIYLVAESDKLLAITLVTLIIALVLNRARDTLRQAVSQTGAVKDLSHFFDKAVVDKITHAEKELAPGQGEMRTAVIMFIDMRGFSKLSEKLPSHELLELLGEYQRLLVPIIQNHQGSIDKFMGDGVLASFGAVIPTKSFAKDALNTVDKIFKEVTQWQEKRRKMNKPVVDVGMGLDIGEVLFGMIGHEQRLEYTLIGETVNIAAKLEKHNKTEQVRALATCEVLNMAKEQGYHGVAREVRKNRSVAGINETLDLVVLA